MQSEKTLEERLEAKERLILRVNYFTIAFTLLFSVICYFFLNIKQIIPHTLLVFGILNLANTLLYYKHKNLTLTYNIVSILTLVGACTITLYSGGINSPFIFVLALIVVAGYVTRKTYGSIYLNLSLIIIVLIYSQSVPGFSFTANVVPENSKGVFALCSILFSIYLLGGVFGKNLLKAHNKLYRVKDDLEAKINEKETLLKEVHHRVKNNLQTVSSLLSLQSRNTNDAELKTILKNSQNRVISMAMVHEMLYMREDIAKIEYKSYVTELAEYLVRSIKGTSSNITLDIDISDVKLNIDTAIPLGLLINESITNALKYGIIDDSKGEIFIKLRKDEDDTYILNLGDSGIGYAETITHKTTKSLGLKLIHNLARQLRGSVIRDISKKGTHYIVKFKEIHQQIPATSTPAV